MNVLDAAMYWCCHPIFDNVLPMYAVDSSAITLSALRVDQVAAAGPASSSPLNEIMRADADKHVIRWRVHTATNARCARVLARAGCDFAG